MARILPPSVFKANFEAAEFAPTQSQRVGERFATPEGLKVGVDVIDRVGGTVSDAVSRYARKQSEVARLRKKKELPGEGFFGRLYASGEDEALLAKEGSGYEAAQGEVLRATTREQRAAGYDKMRKAFDKPGSGRLLSDPSRAPSRLVREDYAALAKASPLLKAGAVPKPYRPMLDDVRSRHKANKPIIDDMNTAVLVREGIAKNPVLSKGFDINNLTDKQAEALVNASSGKLLLLRDDSGDQSVYTVQVRPTKEDEIAMATAMAEGRQSEADNLRDSLRARGRALLGLLNDPNLDQASTDLNKYSMLLDQWRSIVAAKPDDPRAAKILRELESYSGNIAQASGDLPTYLRNYGVRASEAQAAADKKASDVVGAKRERAAELRRKIQVGGATSDEEREYIVLERDIKKAGGTVDDVAPMSAEGGMSEDTAESYSTPGEKAQEDAWARATQAAGRTESEAVSDAVATPPAAPPAAAGDTYMQVAERMRQAGISEENIGIALPGFQLDTAAPSLMDRFRGDTRRKPIRYDRNAGPGTGQQRFMADREDARKAPLRAKTIARMEAARLKTKETFKQPAKPKLAAGPKPSSFKRGASFEEFDKLLKKHKTESGAGERRRIYADYYQGEYYEPNKVAFPNKKEKERLKQIVIKAANKNKVEPWLMLALVAKESGFRPTVVSNSNALGIAQTIPSTFRSVMGKDVSLDKVFDPEIGAEAGARYIAKRIKQYAKKGRSRKEQLQMALAAYNAGSGKLKKHGLKVLLSDRWAKIKSGTNKGKGATRLYVEGILANMPKEKPPTAKKKKEKIVKKPGPKAPKEGS